MRIGLAVSLVVHGAAAVALVLFAEPRAATEPLSVLQVGFYEDASEEVVRPPEPPPPTLEIPAAAVEPDAFPVEALEPEPIEAPREEPAPGVGSSAPTRSVKLAQPLPRRVRARAEPPVPVARAAPKGEVRPPRLLTDRSPSARYPESARRKGLEGTVVLLIGVRADGTVERVEVVTSSGHEELDRAAAEAAEAWHFDPARQGGAAVAHDVRVPVEFRLTDA